MLNMYAKLESVSDMLNEFMLREWKFENSNTQKLWLMLSEEDSKQFWFSLNDFDWTIYMKNYMHGIKLHILHENENNAKEALIKNKR